MYKYNPTTGVPVSGDVNAGAYDAWVDIPHASNAEYEPQRLNNFEFVITAADFGQLLYPGTSTNDGKYLPEKGSEASECIRLSVKSAFIPHFEQEVIEIKRGNDKLRYAGAASYNTGNLVIHDFIGSNAKALLMAWQNLSYNQATEKVGLASSYKKTCELIEYTPDYQIVRRWKLYGCWINNISESDRDYDSSSNVNQVTASIQYDKAVIVQDVPAGFSK